MNTIGKKGKLGEHIRCVVSVAMLTEGWDANTVTHILGIRPFRSQLLCEQVVGRGLRRRSYAVDAETGRFEPEYAEVYGVPFAFIPGDRQIAQAQGPAARRRGASRCRTAGSSRSASRSSTATGSSCPTSRFTPTSTTTRGCTSTRSRSPCGSERSGVVGAAERGRPRRHPRRSRPARRLRASPRRWSQRDEFFAAHDGVERPWLFPQLVDICRRWLDECVTTDPGVTNGLPAAHRRPARAAAEKVFGSITRYPGQPARRSLLPILRRFDPIGSTDEVRFVTRKVVMDPPPTKSHLNHVVLDGVRGNSWEEGLAAAPRARPARAGLREERAPRVHDPLRPRGP